MASGRQVVRDCLSDGELNGHYSQGELKQGLADLPTDAREYTDCADQIQQARRAGVPRHGSSGGGSGGSGGSSGSGGSGSSGAGISSSPDPQGPRERAATDAARTGGDAPVRIGGQPVIPGTCPSIHHPSRMLQFNTPLSAAFIPLVPQASKGRRGLLSHTSQPCNIVRATAMS